ncbi:pleckstrin homology domain-containing family O member 1-like [Brienomyrus brachyistius]|uniref:pleckstrin homology domain-containing family O member 1-like n=1 Tax=Brienomyrus brachyistius TaxID=42636 RepID=UPI0020B2D427|nr:pleckstrin homology domain-containing family O member 1-like [Brienomyrus brachyistius]
MKKSNSAKRGPQDVNQASCQPDKTGWIRKFCGKGIFREIWKNRYVVLKGDQLFISEKEVKDEKKIQEVIDLTDYERSEELRKTKSRSKKNHSKFTLLRSRQPGNTVPNLVFLAVSPEEKESWINALNGAITRAKNRILDEVTVEEESLLAHPTRDRAKIPHTRRLPTRGHLMAVASTSTSDGMLTLDLVQEEDATSPATEGQDSCEGSFRVDLDKSMALLTKRSNSDGCPATPVASEARGKSDSLPRQEGAAHTPEKVRRASLDEILICQAGARPASPTTSTSELQDLIAQKLERTREMLAEVRVAGPEGTDSDSGADRAEVERLLQEAASAWGQARRVLEEVRGLQELYRQLEQSPATPLSPSHTPGPKSPLLADYRKSMM